MDLLGPRICISGAHFPNGVWLCGLRCLTPERYNSGPADGVWHLAGGMHACGTGSQLFSPTGLLSPFRSNCVTVCYILFSCVYEVCASVQVHVQGQRMASKCLPQPLLHLKKIDIISRHLYATSCLGSLPHFMSSPHSWPPSHVPIHFWVCLLLCLVLLWWPTGLTRAICIGVDVKPSATGAWMTQTIEGKAFCPLRTCSSNC